jgi:hypothetical protein
MAKHSTIQSRGGYLLSAGFDYEGLHVIYYDADERREVHLCYHDERAADAFLHREFPKGERGNTSYTGYGANTHAPCGN